MAELGHDVVGVDVDAHKVNLLSNGRAPFFEPELEGLLARNVEAGRLTFTQDFSAIKGAQVHFIGVGTPQSESGAADMTYVDAAVTAMLPHLGHCTSGPEVVAGKSTVPVGTAARLSQLIEPTGALLLWNPEFLREGFAVQDTLRPDRMVYGLPENPDAAGRAQETMDAVYAQILAAGTPRLVMDYATAELVKISANAFLATKISFINAMSQVCDAAGANVTALAEAIGMDDRIGRRFLRAGIGFGGGCLPKDIRAFQARAGELGVGDALAFLAEVDRVNDTMRAGVIRKVAELLGEHTSAATVTVLGAAFKPDSDDMRNSPALDLAVELSESSCTTRPPARSSLRGRTAPTRSPPQRSPPWREPTWSSSARSGASTRILTPPRRPVWHVTATSLTDATAWMRRPGRRPVGATAASAGGERLGRRGLLSAAQACRRTLRPPLERRHPALTCHWSPGGSGSPRPPRSAMSRRRRTCTRP